MKRNTTRIARTRSRRALDFIGVPFFCWSFPGQPMEMKTVSLCTWRSAHLPRPFAPAFIQAYINAHVHGADMRRLTVFIFQSVEARTAKLLYPLACCLDACIATKHNKYYIMQCEYNPRNEQLVASRFAQPALYDVLARSGHKHFKAAFQGKLSCYIIIYCNAIASNKDSSSSPLVR